MPPVGLHAGVGQSGWRVRFLVTQHPQTASFIFKARLPRLRASPWQGPLGTKGSTSVVRSTGGLEGLLLFALLAAFCNALNVVMQHVASIGDPRRSKGWRFVYYLLSNPMWLLGWVALAGAFIFQALALHDGLISVIQPLLVTELAFALVLRWLWLHQSIRPITWWAAVLTCLSLTLFIAMAEPSFGAPCPKAEPGFRPASPRPARRRCWRFSD